MGAQGQPESKSRQQDGSAKRLGMSHFITPSAGRQKLATTATASLVSSGKSRPTPSSTASARRAPRSPRRRFAAPVRPGRRGGHLHRGRRCRRLAPCRIEPPGNLPLRFDQQGRDTTFGSGRRHRRQAIVAALRRARRAEALDERGAAAPAPPAPPAARRACATRLATTPRGRSRCRRRSTACCAWRRETARVLGQCRQDQRQARGLQ